MPPVKKPAKRKSYIIIDPTAFPHPSLTWIDENGDPIYFDTKREAQIEIAEWMIEKLNEFIASERDFYDATTCTDFVLEVDLSRLPSRS